MTALFSSYAQEWLDIALRWLHVVAGIVWIGASFYFVKLDLSLRPPPERDRDEGVDGEYWGLHGGGFYRVHKYAVAPPVLPETLHWFKWQAYTTWLSGFALLAVLYYWEADVRLVDPAVADLSTAAAVAASIGLLAAAWIVYDVACRLLASEAVLTVVLAALVTLSAWGAWQLFSPRAAFLQVGAMLGTIMAANVFFTIIPGSRELVRAKEEGRQPDPAYGRAGKRRSVHNNYLTLPVVFTMISGHFPATFGAGEGWLVLLGFVAIGASIRWFFNLRHEGRDAWWILAGAAGAAAGIAVALAPSGDDAPAAGGPVDFARVQAIVEARCVTCHAGASAPLGVRLETEEQIRARADAIARQVETGAMPLGNATGMTDEERDVVVAWAQSQ